jgi:proteic killer suppression protein
MFKDRGTADVANGVNSKEARKVCPSALQPAARRKLVVLLQAGTLNDLRIPPGNRLEPLLGDREGRHSIRINDRYRVCFRWTDDGPLEIEIVDYH